MSDRNSTALRFVHPDLDADVAQPGIGTDASGRVATVDGDDVVRQSILLLMSTSPGERVMRPDYGCPLNRLAFQPLDHTTAGMAIHFVERAVRRWEPRAEVLKVDAYPSLHLEGSLTIELHYRVRRSRRDHQLEFELAIHGSGDHREEPT